MSLVAPVVGPAGLRTLTEFGYSTTGGDYEQWTFEGEESAIRSAANALRINRPDLNHRCWSSDPPKWTMEVRSPDRIEKTDDTPETIWELDSEDVQRSGWEHPKTVAFVDAQRVPGVVPIDEDLDEDTIRRALKDKAPDARTYRDSLIAPNAQLFFDAMIADDTSFGANVYALRKTQVIRTASQIKAGFNQIGRVWTNAQLIATESIPDAVAFSLASIYPLSAVSGFTVGWNKNAPRVTQLTGSKFQIAQTWRYGRWRNYYYDPAVT